MGRSKKRAAIRTEDELCLSPSSTRTWITGGDLYAEEPQHRNNISRFIVVVISFILVGGGAAIAIIAGVQHNKRILPLCPNCSQLIIMAYCIGGCLALVGVIGMLAAITRAKPLAITFSVLMVLCTLIFAAAGVFVAVYTDGLSQSQVRSLWTDALHDDSSIICDLQSDMSCTGFDHCCIAWSPVLSASSTPSPMRRNAVLKRFLEAPPPTTDNRTDTPSPPVPTAAFPFPNQCNITLDQFNEQCNPSCSTNGVFIETCNSKAESSSKDHFTVIMGIIFGIAAVLLVTAVAAVRMTLRS